MLSRIRPIVVVGSINIDLVTNTERIPNPGETVLGANFQIHHGGKGANQAVAASRLGYPVRMIGCIGNDTFGTQLRTHLESEGVDVTGVTATNGSSGVAVITVSQRGENSIVVTPGANSKVTPEYLEANIEIIRSAGLVLAQLEVPRETVEYLAQTCSHDGIPLILDPAPARDLPPTLFKHIEWFTPNETEAEFFMGNPNGSRDATDPTSIVEKLMSKGVKGVVLKMGARGVYLASVDGLREPLSAYPVEAIDTTAAGDTFNGAFATGLMLGKGPVESARFAAAAAAISATRAGAQSSMPITAEVEQILESNVR
jgi:ribokinase